MAATRQETPTRISLDLTLEGVFNDREICLYPQILRNQLRILISRELGQTDNKLLKQSLVQHILTWLTNRYYNIAVSYNNVDKKGRNTGQDHKQLKALSEVIQWMFDENNDYTNDIILNLQIDKQKFTKEIHSYYRKYINKRKNCTPESLVPNWKLVPIIDRYFNRTVGGDRYKSINKELSTGSRKLDFAEG